MSCTSSSDVNDEDIWKCLEAQQNVINTSASDQGIVSRNDEPLTCTSYYQAMNCGPSGTNLDTRVAFPFSSRSSLLIETSKKNRSICADLRKSQLKSQLMTEDLNRMEQILRSQQILADIHISECRRIYKIIATCMEQLKMKRNKKKVEIASTYYALKQYFNPTPPEIEKWFNITHTLFLASIKQVRQIAHNCPDELGWIFEVERGQTNIFRYASKLNVDWKTLRGLQEFARERNWNLLDESVVVQLLKRVT